ncbi:response regulator [Anabaena sphaerica FACHB-251]|uniref:Response regulator n=1 Tax=Anabaena sphaerica FACHB-251 TaxID=2692883 RepID=A0A926WEF6_9NOST|nr:response regulator [Anabaena sphaerica]MBD2292953.1 response regulator [Anabaena sphaerica FACHB-251]
MYLTHSFMSDEKKQSSQPPLILIVEDHDDSLLLLSYALELLGCRFICQNDSSSTILVAKEYQPDLILLDILLPGMNGLEVVRHLKHESLTCHIPVIAVTALAGREQEERILAAGFDDYLSKPYMLEDLEAIICRLLNEKFEPYSAVEVCKES